MPPPDPRRVINAYIIARVYYINLRPYRLCPFHGAIRRDARAQWREVVCIVVVENETFRMLGNRSPPARDYIVYF